MAHPKDNANRYPPTYAADGLDFRSETDALSTNAFDNRQYTMIESRSGPPINPDGSCKHETQRFFDCRLTSDLQT